MVKKNTRKKTSRQKRRENGRRVELRKETRYSIWGIIFFVLGILIILSIFRTAGVVGDFLYSPLKSLLGLGYYLLPILLIAIGISYLKKRKPQVAKLHAIFNLIILLTSLGIMDLASNGKGESLNINFGGYLGSFIAWPFLKLFGLYAGILILGALLIISIIILFNAKPDLAEFLTKIWNLLKTNIHFKKQKNEEDSEERSEEHTSELQSH